MIVVMMLILTSTAMAAVQMRHMNTALRIEQARVRSESRTQGPVTVLAIACSRLETGDPPGNDVSFRYNHDDGFQTSDYRLRYRQIAPGRWSVSADPDPSSSTLMLLPDRF